jgi:hypothetical protein
VEANFAKIHRFQKDVDDVEPMAFGNTARNDKNSNSNLMII